jgi:3',5'-cyclic-nucleotide phosphodiesterase
VPVNHPVHSTAFLLRGPRGGTVAFSSDTGPTERMWRVLNRTADLRAVFLELSFPTRMQHLADVAGHLTPRTLAAELGKLRADVPVHLYHLKPVYVRELVREVRQLREPRLRTLTLGQRLRF